MRTISRYFIVAIAMCISFLWCGNFLDRPAPSQAGYIADYMKYFDQSNLEKVDYVYKGAIGGACTVGRAQFKGSVIFREIMLREKIKAGVIVEGTYDPAEMTDEVAVMQFRHQWEVHAGGSLPSWFDFPFDRKMRTFTETSEESEACPRSERIWYVDEERNVVYIRANWG